jgi:hypothetical protein
MTNAVERVKAFLASTKKRSPESETAIVSLYRGGFEAVRIEDIRTIIAALEAIDAEIEQQFNAVREEFRKNGAKLHYHWGTWYVLDRYVNELDWKKSSCRRIHPSDILSKPTLFEKAKFAPDGTRFKVGIVCHRIYLQIEILSYRLLFGYFNNLLICWRVVDSRSPIST